MLITNFDYAYNKLTMPKKQTVSLVVRNKRKPKTAVRRKAAKAANMQQPIRVMQVPPVMPKISLPGSTQAGREYVSCLLGLMPGKSARIPDGSECSSLSQSQKLVVSISPDANGNISGWVCPGFPASIFITGGTFTALPLYGTSGVTYTQVSGTPGQIPLGVPFIEDAANMPSTGVLTYYENSRNLTKARFVGGRVTFTPTGPPLTRQGQIAIADVEVNRSGPYPQCIQVTDGANTIPVFAAQATNYTNVGGWGATVQSFMTYQTLSTIPNAETCEYGEVACHAVLEPGTRYGEWKPVCPINTDQTFNPLPLLMDGLPEVQELSNQQLSFTGPPAGVAAGGGLDDAELLYDIINSAAGSLVSPGGVGPFRPAMGNYWTEVGSRFKAFAATGLAPSQPLMVTLELCTEACVDSFSTFRTFTDTVPALDISALRGGRDMVKSLPTSIVAPPSKAWYATLAEVVHAAGSSIKALGIPRVSAYGGIAATLANLALQ